LLFTVILCVPTEDISAQAVPGIVPLQATCDDVKRILNVEHCSFPQSVFLLQDFWIVINFVREKPSATDKWCYKVPAGRVSSFSIAYNKPFPIPDFPFKLKYIEGPFGDIDTVAYGNKEKGISVLTNNGRINTVIVQATPKQRKKFAYNCA